MGCINTTGTIKITTNRDTKKSNELDLKRMLTTIASSRECYDSDSDVSSNISSINNSPILKSNIYVVEKIEK